MPIIYKLACKTIYVLDTYIGRTNNLANRLSNHKYLCDKSDRVLYKTIQENGGWENWYCVAIEECCDFEAKDRELFYVNLYKPSLNKNLPLRSIKQWRHDKRERYNFYMKIYMKNYMRERLKKHKEKLN